MQDPSLEKALKQNNRLLKIIVTLLTLIIVVPIILVLIYIYLVSRVSTKQWSEAETRAKMARAMSDLNTISRSESPEIKLQELKDPYDSKNLYRTITIGGAQYVYSVGPDQADDKASIIYDVTNGTLSAGDVVWEVGKQNGMV